jgi:hypothetical protein
MNQYLQETGRYSLPKNLFTILIEQDAELVVMGNTPSVSCAR